LLIIISLVTSLQQIPALSQSRTTYDEEYVVALRQIAHIIPQNETLAATDTYPQVAYFTDHKVIAPWVRSERALVQFMWKNNCSYLLVPEYTSEPKPDNTPLLIQLAGRPFERISDFYAKYISVPKPEDNTPLFNTSSVPRQDDNSRLDIRKSIKEPLFQKLFEKVLDYPTENSLLHLYQLRSNITPDNLSIVTDTTKPVLSVSLPINGTITEAEFDVLRVNVTGSANDAESKIKKVEVSIGGSPFQLATPRAPNDWSSWSFSDIVTGGTTRIMVRATDNADKREWAPVFITIK
jgi:Bacterial Ig domain